MGELVIKTRKLTKKYGDFIAANELTMDVEAGEIFGFLGANGAGKNYRHEDVVRFKRSLFR
jgi:ABC-2 type transport system ATP-binding protein